MELERPRPAALPPTRARAGSGAAAAGPIELAVAYEGAEATVTVSGEVDVQTGHRLEAVLRAALAMGATTLVVDVAGVTFLDSSGLAVLANAARETRRRDGLTVVAGASTTVRRLLLVTGVDSVVELR